MFPADSPYKWGEDGEVSGMALTVIWTGMVVVSILCGLATGN